MRDYNMTDHEQVEMIKQWWQDYGKYLAIAIVLGIVFGLGWRSWHQHQLNSSVQASSLYQQLLVADTRMDTASVNQIAKMLGEQHSSSPYVVMTKLILAKEAVQANELSQALVHLNWVIAHSHNPSFRQITRIRVARILLAEHQAPAALPILSIVDDNTFDKT